MIVYIFSFPCFDFMKIKIVSMKIIINVYIERIHFNKIIIN